MKSPIRQTQRIFLRQSRIPAVFLALSLALPSPALALRVEQRREIGPDAIASELQASPVPLTPGAGAEETAAAMVVRLGQSSAPVTRGEVEGLRFRILQEAGEAKWESLANPSYVRGESSPERLADLLLWMNASPEVRLSGMPLNHPDSFDLLMYPFRNEILDPKDPVAHAALIAWAMSTFPIFSGGNHRTGWALMNVALMRSGVLRQPLVWQESRARRYYEILGRLDPAGFVTLIRSYIDTDVGTESGAGLEEGGRDMSAEEVVRRVFELEPDSLWVYEQVKPGDVRVVTVLKPTNRWQFIDEQLKRLITHRWLQRDGEPPVLYDLVADASPVVDGGGRMKVIARPAAGAEEAGELRRAVSFLRGYFDRFRNAYAVQERWFRAVISNDRKAAKRFERDHRDVIRAVAAMEAEYRAMTRVVSANDAALHRRLQDLDSEYWALQDRIRRVRALSGGRVLPQTQLGFIQSERRKIGEMVDLLDGWLSKTNGSSPPAGAEEAGVSLSRLRDASRPFEDLAEAARKLAWDGTPQAIAGLKAVVGDSAFPPKNRAAAAAGLGLHGDPEHLADLMEALISVGEQGRSKKALVAIANALAQLNYERLSDVGFVGNVLKEAERLGGVDLKQAYAAVVGHGARLNYQRVLSGGEMDSDTFQQFVSNLSGGMKPVLRRLSADPQQKRVWAADRLGKLGMPFAIPAVRQALEDALEQDPEGKEPGMVEMQVAAVEALSRLVQAADPVGRGPLVSRLRKEAMEFSLARLDPAKILNPILRQTVDYWRPLWNTPPAAGAEEALSGRGARDDAGSGADPRETRSTASPRSPEPQWSHPASPSQSPRGNIQTLQRHNTTSPKPAASLTDHEIGLRNSPVISVPGSSSLNRSMADRAMNSRRLSEKKPPRTVGILQQDSSGINKIPAAGAEEPPLLSQDAQGRVYVGDGRWFRSDRTFVPDPSAKLLLKTLREKVPLRRDMEVLNLGVGSWSVALAIAGRVGRLVAVDKDPTLARWARENAAAYGLTNVEVVEAAGGDLLAPDAVNRRYDLVIATPALVPFSDEMRALVRKRAGGYADAYLRMNDGGPDGRREVDRILGRASSLLKPGGTLLLLHPQFLGWNKTQGRMISADLESRILAQEDVPVVPPHPQSTNLLLRFRGFIEAANGVRLRDHRSGGAIYRLAILQITAGAEEALVELQYLAKEMVRRVQDERKDFAGSVREAVEAYRTEAEQKGWPEPRIAAGDLLHVIFGERGLEALPDAELRERYFESTSAGENLRILPFVVRAIYELRQKFGQVPMNPSPVVLHLDMDTAFPIGPTDQLSARAEEALIARVLEVVRSAPPPTTGLEEAEVRRAIQRLSDPDVDVRAGAAWELVGVAQRGWDGVSPEVREEAARALAGRLLPGAEPETTAIIDPVAWDAVMALTTGMLTGRMWWESLSAPVRGDVVRGLAAQTAGARATVPRNQAAWVLERAVRTLEGTSASVREEVARMLAGCLLKDPEGGDEFSRRHAARALSGIDRSGMGVGVLHAAALALMMEARRSRDVPPAGAVVRRGEELKRVNVTYEALGTPLDHHVVRGDQLGQAVEMLEECWGWMGLGDSVRLGFARRADWEPDVGLKPGSQAVEWIWWLVGEREIRGVLSELERVSPPGREFVFGVVERAAAPGPVGMVAPPQRILLVMADPLPPAAGAEEAVRAFRVEPGPAVKLDAGFYLEGKGAAFAPILALLEARGVLNIESFAGVVETAADRERLLAVVAGDPEAADLIRERVYAVEEQPGADRQPRYDRARELAERHLQGFLTVVRVRTLEEDLLAQLGRLLSAFGYRMPEDPAAQKAALTLLQAA